MLYSVLHILWIGIVVGLSSGMFGIGGALLSTPLLRIFLELPPVVALGTPILVAIPSAISGSIAYYRKKLLLEKVAFLTLVSGIPANILGSYATEWVSGKILMVLTALFLLLTSALFFLRGWIYSASEQQSAQLSPLAIIIVGICAGFLSGFLAIGGGIILVPAYVRILRLSMKQALATSLFCVAGFALPAAIVHYLLGHIHLPTAVLLSFVVVPCSYLGARIAIALRNRTLERIYGTVLSLFSLYFLYTQL